MTDDNRSKNELIKESSRHLRGSIAEGLRSGRGLDNDVTEGLVAFQLSIKPEW